MITLTHTISCKSSLSLSFNTFERYPLLLSSFLNTKCSCYCCCCCYCASVLVCSRLGPGFLCKKLIFSGNTFRVLSCYDDGRSCCYEKVCGFEEKRKCGKRGFRCDRRKQVFSNVSDDVDVDVMLSLLTEEGGSECVDVRERRKIGKEKKNVVKIRALAESKNLELRKDGSDGELEGEKVFDVGKTSSSEYKNDLKRGFKSRIDEVGNIEERKECVEEKGKLVEKDDSVKGDCAETIGVRLDWRKTSEKKLNEEDSDVVDQNTDELVSRMKYRRFPEMLNNDNSVIELASCAEKKLKPISEVPESRMKRLDEMSIEVNDMIEDSRKKIQQYTNSENTSISHRKEFKMAKQKQYLVAGITKGKKTIIEDNIPSSEMISVEEGCGPKGGGSRHSSQGSGPKGPSDEMWHVTDASTQDSSETDAPEPDNISDFGENGEAVKTSSRSFWSVIVDVVRLNWKSPRSESHTPNSGSEAWFSSTKGLDSPLTSSNFHSGPSISTSLPIIKESSGIKKTSEAGETGKSGNDPKNGKLKRRKLVHKDEVSKDRFDEWEDAYNLENEQRKEDEMFMREALLEAKKAADVWEVPVGAVLVKGGKIIARGYNLVEELRDSTAHAEMICIRKASTNLQSWRLSDTTLYVTLEPCPMCAGAILQARIDTVVWGAPNKLLGADGSWIRLFSDADGGNDSMLTDKPSAPKHPFHPNMVVRRGVLAPECSEVMRNFFRLRRKMITEPKPEPGPEPEPPTLTSSITVSHDHHRDQSDFFSKMQHFFKIIFCL